MNLLRLLQHLCHLARRSNIRVLQVDHRPVQQILHDLLLGLRDLSACPRLRVNIRPLLRRQQRCLRFLGVSLQPQRLFHRIIQRAVRRTKDLVVFGQKITGTLQVGPHLRVADVRVRQLAFHHRQEVVALLLGGSQRVGRHCRLHNIRFLHHCQRIHEPLVRSLRLRCTRRRRQRCGLHVLIELQRLLLVMLRIRHLPVTFGLLGRRRNLRRAALSSSLIQLRTHLIEQFSAAAAERVVQWGLPQLRDLPWRRTRDPWEVLVSEVMLQQTQAARVVPKWRAFIDEFPTPQACAAAPLGDVLRRWQGLGYPRRARNLHAAATEVARLGAFPDSLEGLLALPGVGAYTARAVLAFAFLLEPGGLLAATLAIVVIGAFGGPEFRLVESLVLAAGLAVGAIVIFVYGLKLPMPIWPAFLS